MSSANDYGWDDVLYRLRQGLLDPRWSDVLQTMEALVGQLRRVHQLPIPWVSHCSLRYPVLDSLGWVVVCASDNKQYDILVERIGTLENIRKHSSSLEFVVKEIERALYEAPYILSSNPLASNLAD